MTRGHYGSHIGPYIQGYLDAFDIPRKAICAHTGIHESSLSRKINGEEDFKANELFSIGVAAGKSLAQSQAAKRA